MTSIMSSPLSAKKILPSMANSLAAAAILEGTAHFTSYQRKTLSVEDFHEEPEVMAIYNMAEGGGVRVNHLKIMDTKN